MREYCEQFGTVVECLIMREKETKKSKGYGFVIFKSDKAVKEIINHGKTIGHKLNEKIFECKLAIKKEILDEEKNFNPVNIKVKGSKKSKNSNHTEEADSTLNSSKKIDSKQKRDENLIYHPINNFSFQSSKNIMNSYSYNPYFSPNYIHPYFFPQPIMYPFMFNSSNSINNNNFICNTLNNNTFRENCILSSNANQFMSSKNVNPMNMNLLLSNNKKEIKKKKKKKEVKKEKKKSSKFLHKSDSKTINQKSDENLVIESHPFIDIDEFENKETDDLECNKLIDELKNGNFLLFRFNR